MRNEEAKALCGMFMAPRRHQPLGLSTNLFIFFNFILHLHLTRCLLKREPAYARITGIEGSSVLPEVEKFCLESKFPVVGDSTD
jgi:hypothetical protein